MNPILEAMVSIALALWGSINVFLSPPISIGYEETATYPGAYAYARRHWIGGVVVDCEIWLNPDGDFDALTAEQRQAVVAHEVGHCLGLNHIEEPGLMFRAPLYYGGVLTQADIDECYRVHPVRPSLPFRVFASIATN